MKKYFLSITILILSIQFSFAQNGWQVLNTNTTLDLQELQCLSVDTVFMYGDNGILLKSFDDGNSFTTLNNGSAAIYMAGFFLDADTGFASTGSGNIIRSTNGGSNWGVTGGCTCLIDAICFSNKQTGLYGSLSGVHRSSDGGLSWSPSAVLPVTPHEISALNDSVFVTVYHQSFYKSSDYGLNFNSDTVNHISAYPLTGFSFYTPQNGYVISADGHLYHTNTQGDSWNHVADLALTNITQCVFVDSLNGYLVGSNMQNIIYKTTNGGFSWTVDYTAAASIECLRYDGHHLFACGQNGMALRKETYPTAVNEIADESRIKIYPNPAHDFISVTGLSGNEKIQLFNSIGEKITVALKERRLDVSKLNSGIYFLRIIEDEKTSSFVFEKL